MATELRGIEDEIERLVVVRNATAERRATQSGPLVRKRAVRLLGALREPLDRGAANTALRALFRSAVVNYLDGTLDLEWTHGGECSVPFAMPAEAA